MNQIKEYMVNKELDMERIIKEYSGYLLKVVSNLCGGCLPQEDIDEILFDVFSILWENRKKLELEKDIKPYMASIAHHVAKRRMTKQHHFYVETDWEESEIQDERMEDLADMLDHRMQLQEIENILEDFEQEDYQIFTYFYYDSLRTKEIAEKLGISNMKVKTRLHRMRKKMKQKLKERGYSL